jgi:hypothetical protein
MSDNFQGNGPNAGTEEWVLTVSDGDFQIVKAERLPVQTGPSREFIVTVDKAALTPLKIEATTEAGSRRELTPHEYNALTGAYAAALASSEYGKMWANAMQYWQTYYSGAADAAQGSALSPQELAYYQAIAMQR